MKWYEPYSDDMYALNGDSVDYLAIWLQMMRRLRFGGRNEISDIIEHFTFKLR